MSANITRFTLDARRILAYATEAALQRHNPYVDVEHVMLGVLQINDEPLRSVLRNVDRQTLSQQINAELGIIRETPMEKAAGLTTSVKALLEESVRQSLAMGHHFVNGGHILLAMFQADSQIIRQALAMAALSEQTARQIVETNSPRLPAAPPPAQPPRMQVLFETARQRQRRQAGFPTETSSTPSWGFYALAAVTGLAIYLAVFDREVLISFGLVFAAWIFSLTLHEFSHALVAYWGGDYTVREKDYLSFNPLRYMHPILSLLLPLLFLLMGGIGLPGGAVYIEVHRLRSKWWRTAVSLAGPASNALLAVIFSAPFWLGLIELPATWYWGFTESPRLEAALAFIVFLQVTAVIFNLLPIPPLDGFNAISEFLPPDIVRQARTFGILSLFLIFYLFQVPAFADPFWGAIQDITHFLNVPWDLIRDGLSFFRFWRN
jgi:Zn-dependent protease